MSIDDSWMNEEEVDESSQPLSEAKKEKLRKRAINVSLYWLGREDQPKAKIKEKLVRKEIPEDIIEETIAYLEELDYTNDEKYAENFVRSRSTYRLQGKTAIQYDMIRKGIDREIAAEAVSTLDSETEEENARELIAKRIRSTQGLDRQKRMNRLVGLLARKGYSPSVAFSLVREALDAEKDSDLNDEDEQ